MDAVQSHRDINFICHVCQYQVFTSSRVIRTFVKSVLVVVVVMSGFVAGSCPGNDVG
jgi:hypothetical protein